MPLDSPGASSGIHVDDILTPWLEARSTLARRGSSGNFLPPPIEPPIDPPGPGDRDAGRRRREFWQQFSIVISVAGGVGVALFATNALQTLNPKYRPQPGSLFCAALGADAPRATSCDYWALKERSEWLKQIVLNDPPAVATRPVPTYSDPAFARSPAYYLPPR